MGNNIKTWEEAWDDLDAAYAMPCKTPDEAKKRGNAEDSATGEIIKLIVNDFDGKINAKQARIIWKLAYEQGHAYGCRDIAFHLETLMDTFRDFVAEGEKAEA